MKTPCASSQSILRKQRSRFIGILDPASSDYEVEECLRMAEKKYHDAAHICYAFRLYDRGLGVREGRSDAGEPPGTAGDPILLRLRRAGIVNVVLVVVRYFGGVKLGKGGLARAYSECASRVINVSGLSDFIPMTRLDVQVPYEFIGSVRRVVYNSGGEILNEEFTERSQMAIEIPINRVEQFKENVMSLSSGKIHVVFSNESL